ncbi:Bardet-Biedl syndrome 2 protein homolog isoform X2 [Cylas formicarius]|nr:Bardet-Biedl syndrome 2 protein homolog isoform X2 [Cylas formicarius]
MIVVGGNSSVRAFDHQGDEIFWVAIGDVVTSVILMDYDKDGDDELVVSSEDYKIRVFKDRRVITEQIETEVVTGLVVLPENKFAYSVSNGTIGVYERDLRTWRVKSKNFAVAIHPYDLLGQTQPQLITGWSNGKIDCRSITTGEVIFKDSFTAGIAGIVQGDYRSLGKSDLICVSSEGEVRGYCVTKTAGFETSLQQETVRDLLSQKQALLMELKHYESNARYNSHAEGETESFETSGVIPANTRLQLIVTTKFGKGDGKGCVEVFVSTNNSTVIRALVIFAEGIFKGESHVVHPDVAKLSSDLAVPLYIPKDNATDIHINAHVGYPNSIQFHIFEITKQLPQFSMYALNAGISRTTCDSFVQFKANDRVQRMCIWINQNFLLATDIEFESGPNLTVNLKCLRDDSDLKLVFETTGKITFYTENMFLAADLVQSLATFLNLDRLESVACFPRDEENIKNLMQKLGDIQETRLRLGTDVADKLNTIRNLVIRAEDSRINDTKDMADCYHELNAVNKEIIGGYNIKVQNYNEGLETMKKINTIIQNASRLRVGRNAATMVQNCRNAIKNNNIEGLIKIMKTGE